MAKRVETTHYIPWDSPRMHRGRRAQATCGVTVDVRLHRSDPTCPACAEYLVSDARAFHADDEDDELPLED